MQFYEVRKDRPIIGLADLARRIIEDSLPIKCLEAVILAIFLTNEITNSVNGLEKFTIGFKTSSKGNIHRHVVLGVYCHDTGLYGALGISRRADLGYKPLKFKSLADLLQDYITCYSVYLHRVKRIKIGLPIPGSNRSFESIPWNGCTINVGSMSSSDRGKLIEKHSRIIRHHSSLVGVKQSTSLSLRNLTNLQGPSLKNRSKSYLGIHLEELEKSLKRDTKVAQKTTDSDYAYDFDTDLDSDRELSATETKLGTYFPRTAPNTSFLRARKHGESLTNLSLIDTSQRSTDTHSSNFYTSSGNLLTRRKKSIRV